MSALAIVITGVIATAAADLWQQALTRATGLPVANWGMIGRWVAGMSRGVFAHRSIANAAPVKNEGAIGWVFHYLVGIVYAAAYLAVITATGADPSFANALAFAVATLAAPWFVMQPALGFGIIARHLPNRRSILFVTTTTHLVFGCGLYFGVLASVAPRSIAPMFP